MVLDMFGVWLPQFRTVVFLTLSSGNLLQFIFRKSTLLKSTVSGRKKPHFPGPKKLKQISWVECDEWWTGTALPTDSCSSPLHPENLLQFYFGNGTPNGLLFLSTHPKKSASILCCTLGKNCLKNIFVYYIW